MRPAFGASEGTPSNSRTLLIITAVVVVLLAAGGGAYAAFGSRHTGHRAYALATSDTETNFTQTTPYTQTDPTETDTYSTNSTTTSATTRAALPPGACSLHGVQLKDGINLSCPFARDIVSKLSAYLSDGSTLSAGAASLRVSSPATGLTYSVTCSLARSTVDCHNDESADADNGSGNNDVTFPVSLVR